MRISYMAPVLTAAILSLIPSEAEAYVTTDYNGQYDVYYTNVSADLMVGLTINGSLYEFPLKFQVTLENELVPYSYVDVLVASAEATLENYYPTMPSRIQSLLLKGFESGVTQAIDVINTETAVLPDVMALSAMYSKYVYGTFADNSGQGDQMTLYGTLDPNTGSLLLLPLMQAHIDPTGNFVGDGQFLAEDLDVNQVVNGINVHLVGDIQAGFNLSRM